ncbi:MAG: saccharopine dehydrogenase NADP-binding domain-containing protein [Planctomycetota bacterium]
MSAAAAERPLVVVFGGSGFFGRRLVEDLLQHSTARVRVVGRSGPPEPGDGSQRVEALRGDQRDRGQVEHALQGAAVAVHAAGPYVGLEPHVAEAAIELGLPYVDLADDRAFYGRVRALDDRAREAGVPLMPGASAVPGLSGVFARAAEAELGPLRAVRSAAAPGTYGSRGGGTFVTLLTGAGRPLRVPDLAGPRDAWGWSEPEWTAFPAPVGRRRTYLAVDVADLELFPERFGARRVEFRAGSEFPWLNALLGLVARVRRRIGIPRLERWEPWARYAVGAVGQFGTRAGGLWVETTSEPDAAASPPRPLRRRRYAVVSADRGAWIPALPAAILTARLLRGEAPPPGLAPPWTWGAPEAFAAELTARGFPVFLADEDGPWAPWPRAEEHGPDAAPTIPPA